MEGELNNQNQNNGNNNNNLNTNYQLQFSSGTPPNSNISSPSGNNTNLFVNYLPPSVNDEILRQMFSPYGDIESCKVMIDLTTGQSRCFGFVKFKSVSEAEQAVLSLNGYRLENKTLVVKPANTVSFSGSQGIPSNNIYVKGIPIGVTDEYLVQLFSGFGSIVETKVLMDPVTNYSRGMGFVRFSSLEEAENAIEALNGQVVAGSIKPLIVKFADTDDERKIRKTRQQIRMTSRFSPYGVTNPMGFNNNYPTPNSMQPPQMYYGKFGNNPMMNNPMVNNMGGVAAPMGATTNGQERNLFIYHLPSEADEALLYKLFSPYGAIESVKVITDAQSGTCKGYGFVKMVNLMDAWSAIQMLNGAKVGDKYIQVSFKKSNH